MARAGLRQVRSALLAMTRAGAPHPPAWQKLASPCCDGMRSSSFWMSAAPAAEWVDNQYET